MRRDGERVFLTADEAIGVLADGERVHTFRNTGPILIGADWDRPDVVEEFRRAGEVKVAGSMARGMGHALVTPDRLFVAHDEARLMALGVDHG